MAAPGADRPVTLAHGNGGLHTRELVNAVFGQALGHLAPDARRDAGRLPQTDDAPLLMTTDSFTVQPLEFPGGDIGSLAVHGSFNDLAVSGAEPVALSLNVLVEEGFGLERLGRLARSLAGAAGDVPVTCADTKVLPAGHGGGLYLATSAVGRLVRDPALATLGIEQIRPGDRLVVSGPVGDHGTTVMLAREDFGLSADLRSDAGSVLPLVRAIRDLPGLRFMRDPTRGGLATVCHEISETTGLGVRLQADRIPLRDPVRAVCEMLGFDPLYLACEGRVVAVAEAETADQIVDCWRGIPGGERAACAGEIFPDPGNAPVRLVTELGGERLLMALRDDPLPRIC
ncbi:MAG: hydrogenase expression/formation protein HypE [Halothiobacillaceae bacterium]